MILGLQNCSFSTRYFFQSPSYIDFRVRKLNRCTASPLVIMLPDDADSTMFVNDDDDDDDGNDESGHEYPDNFQAEDFCCDIELLPTVI